jgi:hypothetical protein
MSTAGHCSICASPARLAWVAEMLRLGRSAYAIDQASREPDARDRGIASMRYETIRRHVAHLAEEQIGTPAAADVIEVASPRVVDPRFERVPGKPVEDVASLVQTRAIEGIKDGTLRVTTQHGLSAQKMLDAREDKRRDRELALNVARMLSGAMPVPDHLVINVTPREAVPEDYTPALPGTDIR